MIRLASDENFNGKVLDQLRKRLPDLDLVRVQDTGVYQAPDSAVLEWAAQQNRILLTHDVQTLTDDAYRRVESGLPMPGVIEVSTEISIGRAVDDLEVMTGAGQPEDFENQIKYIPIR